MNTVARISPAEYVDKLHNLRVPGYKGEPTGMVSISTYLCANSSFGGAANANALALNLRRIAQAHNEGSINQPGFWRIFSGQGSRDNFVAAMTLIDKYQDEFKKVKELVKYFSTNNFLQAMIDDKCFGLDCIGFVGTWLVEACLEASYVGRRPLDYAAVFKPVKSLDEVADNSVVMLTNGMHIQVIDYVKSRNGDKSIMVDLCQSSSGGPQRNVSVTIHSGGGSFLPVEDFRKALATKQYDGDWKADNQDRQNKGLGQRDYESYLRARLTQSNTRFGYAGGAIFTIAADGSPRNPVGGSIYIGAAGVTVGPPMPK
jgi:hypothetical protein